MYNNDSYEFDGPGFGKNSFNNNSNNSFTTETTDIDFFKIVMFPFQVFAIYLSFRRNRGFHLGSFVAAVWFFPLYLLYVLSVPVKKFK